MGDRERCAACGQRIASGEGPPICEMCYPGYEYGIKMAAKIANNRVQAWSNRHPSAPDHLYRLEAIAIRDEILGLKP